MHLTFKRLAAITFVAVGLALLQNHASVAAAASSDLSCGVVDLGSSSSADVAKAFNCFNTAFKSCEPATLVATSNEGADASASTFATFSGDRGCAVSETVERSTGSAKTVDSYVCQGLSKDGNALHFTGCGDQKEVLVRPVSKM